MTPTEVDMIFIQTKERKGRRLDYIQFLTAIDRMAQVKYPDDGRFSCLRLPVWCRSCQCGE